MGCHRPQEDIDVISRHSGQAIYTYFFEAIFPKFYTTPAQHLWSQAQFLAALLPSSWEPSHHCGLGHEGLQTQLYSSCSPVSPEYCIKATAFS